RSQCSPLHAARLSPPRVSSYLSRSGFSPSLLSGIFGPVLQSPAPPALIPRLHLPASRPAAWTPRQRQQSPLPGPPASTHAPPRLVPPETFHRRRTNPV